MPPIRAASLRSRGDRRGMLGLVLVILALAVGGVAAYFIATADDLGDEAEAPSGAPGGDRGLAPGAVPAATRGQQPGSEAAGHESSPSPSPTPSPSPSPSPSPTPSGDPGATSADGATTGTESAEAESPTAGGASETVSPIGDGDETNRRPTALITLRIDSLPRGAAVIRKADGVRLGETPYEYQVEPQGSPISFVLRHKGYRDEPVTMPGNRSSERTLSLTRGEGADRAPSLKD